jgi:hypothetical protein
MLKQKDCKFKSFLGYTETNKTKIKEIKTSGNKQTKIKEIKTSGFLSKS